MNPPEPPPVPPTPPPDLTPPPPPPSPHPIAKASSVVAILVAPGALCLITGLLAGRTNEPIVPILILLFSTVGSLVAGIVAGIRTARAFAHNRPASPLAMAGFSVLLIAAAGIISVGGCFFGLIGSTDFR